MALFLYVCIDSKQWFEWTAFDRAFNLALWIALGGLVYAVSLLLTGIKPKELLTK